MTTKTAKKPDGAKPSPDENGQNAPNTPPKAARKRRELTLDEMSLRAYKMTYERLHGKGKKAVAKKTKTSPAALPKVA